MLGLNRTGTHESIAALGDFTRAVLSSIRRYRWLGSSFYVLQSALTVLAALAVDCPAFQTLVGWRPALWPRLLVDVCGHPLSRIREFTGVPGLSLRRDYAISMNVESYMATMRGQSMGGVSSRVMISPNGARLTGSSTNALMPRMWLAGSMLRWYLTCMGILLVADPEHEIQLRFWFPRPHRHTVGVQVSDDRRGGVDHVLGEMTGLFGEFWAGG